MVGSWAARATTKHGESIRRWSGQPTTVCLPGCGDGRTRCRVDRIQLSDLGFGNISALRTVQRRRLHGADQRSGRYVCVIERHSVDGGRPGRGPRTFRHGEEPSRSCDRRGRDSARDMDSGVRCSADHGIDCADAAVVGSVGSVRGAAGRGAGGRRGFGDSRVARGNARQRWRRLARLRVQQGLRTLCGVRGLGHCRSVCGGRTCCADPDGWFTNRFTRSPRFIRAAGALTVARPSADRPVAGATQRAVPERGSATAVPWSAPFIGTAEPQMRPPGKRCEGNR